MGLDFLEQILPRLETLDLKLLTRLDTILLEKFSGNSDLPISGECGFHMRKIAFYLKVVKFPPIMLPWASWPQGEVIPCLQPQVVL